ncbi:MAG: V-type ATP synthase subunit B [Caldibacillus sp.]
MIIKEYTQLQKLEGPLMVVSGVDEAAYDEIVEIKTSQGLKHGRVIQLEDDIAVIQVFESTANLSVDDVRIRFTGKPLKIKLSRDILGRTFNGIGEPIDGGGEIFYGVSRDVNGRPMNPVSRHYPRNFIQTGISSIDGLTTLIRGQKLPIFSGSGLPHNQIAAQIVKQAKIFDEENSEFTIVFAAMGIKHDDAHYFQRVFAEWGVMDRVVMFLNLADDPVVERIATPRCALTAAEYLAFEENHHVLVIMTDITNYCEALREISSIREEVPGRKGYPGYLYSDLASLYERAGMMKEAKGSVTQIPILTMPNDDITHPIPDLTGYITEGQIVLSRELFRKNIYPPVNILPSLSRLMKDGIGEGYTRADHADVANQIFASYSRVQEVLALSQVIGEEELSELDQKYLEFGRAFENRFLKQDFNEERDIEETLDLAWEILSILPKQELNRIDPEIVEEKYRG